MKVIKLLRFSAFLVIISSLLGCLDISLWETEPEYGTCVDDNSVLVGIDIEPNPVVIGKSIVFTCNMNFHKDARDITYSWQPDTCSLIITSEKVENFCKVKAPIKPGTYVGSVFVNYHIGDWGCNRIYGKHEYFSYEVIPK